MDIEAATNPVEAEDNVSATLPDAQEVETDGQSEETLFDEDGNPLSEEEELELDEAPTLTLLPLEWKSFRTRFESGRWRGAIKRCRLSRSAATRKKRNTRAPRRKAAARHRGRPAIG
jgi:hypothetical protein